MPCRSLDFSVSTHASLFHITTQCFIAFKTSTCFISCGTVFNNHVFFPSSSSVCTTIVTIKKTKKYFNM
uniref:Uncharacterized protein n=1 Tax=Anguilla anguilla TaxID=7936 RepID=A0A0E9XK25_ANGAN